jgi:vacuolar iron transporter family protein
MEPTLEVQRAEITEYHIYMRLAEESTIPENKKLLKQIAADELRHYHFWKRRTKCDVRPDRVAIWWSVFMSKIFGVTFTLQLRELGEKDAQEKYSRLHGVDVRQLIKEEEQHEQMLITMLKDERLEYAGAIVLGMNDALVELTGALAGLTLALRDSTLVAIAGLVTGIAAAMSMAASGYFQSKENGHHHPIKSAIYTGVTYIVVVLLLIAPYFIFSEIFVSLSVTIAVAVLIIAVYTYYITMAKKQPFWSRFLEMAAISLVVALISFGVGWLLSHFIGI